MRGPGIRPLVPGTAAGRTRRESFDRLVLDTVRPLDERWHRRLGLVEYAVEEAPLVPDDWGDEDVPLSALVPPTAGDPARVVLFRRPLEHRADTRAELRALVHAVVVEQLAELLGLPPEDIDDRYGD